MPFDVIVVGGGHAGIEAALAADRLSCRVLLVTSSIGRIGEMSCNPAIGGIAKGTLVREIDALDGAMGMAADATRLQFRMLNMRKGPAVQGPRVQSDAGAYADYQRSALGSAGVTLLQDEVVALSGPTEAPEGVVCRRNGFISGRAVVLAVGTFLGGTLFRGGERWRGGRTGDISSDRLDSDLRRRMFHVKRFKTGTPPRVVAGTVDLSVLEVQETQVDDFRFSFREGQVSDRTAPCFLTHSGPRTVAVARKYLDSSPLMSGRIEGTGPRYCPSFEDKVVKFPDRDRHSVYVEPMGWRSRLFYLNGVSTSLSREAQYGMVRSLPGFGDAEIASFGYAVEYGYIDHGDISETLRLRGTRNLFVAGQICGTSGYEEAAALGLLAGANAARQCRDLEPITAERLDSYLGVMVDDIVGRGADEPYRLFSSRAENRLHIRHDNADRRMMDLGTRMGILSGSSRERCDGVRRVEKEIRAALRSRGASGVDGEKLCRRPGVTTEDIVEEIPELAVFDSRLLRSVMLDEKYSGYISRNRRRLETRKRSADIKLDRIGSYMDIEGICWEAREALQRRRPGTLAEAAEISGVRPTDLEGLLLHLAKGCSTWNDTDTGQRRSRQ